MDLRFVSPTLPHIDDLELEVLACTLWSDARPMHGLAGLCDWRLAGRLSSLLHEGFVTGDLGEVVLLPARPRLRFDKLLLFGAGPRESFGEPAFEAVVRHMLDVMEGLCARVAAVELPGRRDELITAERAAELLLASAAGNVAHDAWTLVEDAAGKQRIVQHLTDERRRVRRLP